MQWLLSELFADRRGSAHYSALSAGTQLARAIQYDWCLPAHQVQTDSKRRSPESHRDAPDDFCQVQVVPKESFMSHCPSNDSFRSRLYRNLIQGQFHHENFSSIRRSSFRARVVTCWAMVMFDYHHSSRWRVGHVTHHCH